MSKYKPEGGEGDDKSLREQYRLLAKLPTDPDRLMKRMRQDQKRYTKGMPSAQRDFQVIRTGLRFVIVPPDVRAGLYRALAKAPGVKVVDHLVKDAIGRDAIAITFTTPKPDERGGRYRYEVLLNPDTYAYQGERDIAVSDVKAGQWSRNGPVNPGAGKVKAGTVLTDIARAASAIVDRPGQRG